MKIQEFKAVVSDFLKGMVGQWFPDRALVKGLALTLIDANVNKFDNLISLFADENGDIDIDGLKKNMGDAADHGYEIDLQQYHPMLPNRILLITKEDVEELFRMLSQSKCNQQP
jgi:hypothetical protein